MFYLWGKGVLKAQLLKSWPKLEDGMDVEDWDGQVERLGDKGPGGSFFLGI